MNLIFTKLKPFVFKNRILENLHLLYKENSYNSSELTGASLYEAIDRYKKYERKLKDTIRPNEDTLKRLSSQPHMPQPPPHTKSNFNIFPNGGKVIFK